jgi:hypothetical protein
MGARLGIRDSAYNPYGRLGYDEQMAWMQLGVYPNQPQIESEAWEALKHYVLAKAPQKWETIETETWPETSQFTARPIRTKQYLPNITFLDVQPQAEQLIAGSMDGQLIAYDLKTQTDRVMAKLPSATTHMKPTQAGTWITLVGNLHPSELHKGYMAWQEGDRISVVSPALHRPVHSTFHDLDQDGAEEIIICEFGHQSGRLSLWRGDKVSGFTGQPLLGLPGSIRTQITDLDGNGLDDVLVLQSQGNENITVLYQTGPLEFTSEVLLRFPPTWGSSWFELIDINGDGYKDLVTAHGDNADETYVQKTYHGIRFYLNNGKQQFKESHFIPLNGATRFEIADFDNDQDLDLAVLAAFPDYAQHPERALVYLENQSTPTSMAFTTYNLPGAADAKWFLMKAADIDADGDTDLVVGAMHFGFGPVPDSLHTQWRKDRVPLLILENQN